METNHHKNIEKQLVDIGFKNKLFWKKVSGVLDDDFSRTRYGFVPDCFYIDEQNRTIFCIEIENYHRFNKLWNYAYFAFDVDCCSWFTHLFVLSRFGSVIIEYNDETLIQKHIEDMFKEKDNGRD